MVMARRTNSVLVSKSAAILFGFSVNVLAHTGLASNAAASQGDNQSQTGDAENVAGTPPATGRELNAAIRDAIFRNREQLLYFLSDKKTRKVFCTPLPNESYDLFQASLHEQLDVLWNLDIYASKYALTGEQHRSVKLCSAEMEKYLDNFQLWKKLNRDVAAK
jgi:hypothetical protein